MHAGAVPVTLHGLRVIFDVVSIGLGQAIEEIACEPQLVTGVLGTLGEHLELPLPTGNLLVDALEVDARLEAEVRMLLDEGAAVGVLPPTEQ